MQEPEGQVASGQSDRAISIPDTSQPGLLSVTSGQCKQGFTDP